MKLKFEALPPRTHGRNIKNLYPKKWDIIRKEVYKKYNYSCSICKRKVPKGFLHAHEVWDFIIETKTQKLADIIAVCKECHSCLHCGRTGCIARWGDINRYKKEDFDSMSPQKLREKYGEPEVLQKMKNHFMEVNNCNLTDIELDIKISEAIVRALELDRYNFENLDLSYMDTFLKDPDQISFF